MPSFFFSKPATVPVNVSSQLGLGEDDDRTSASPSKERVQSAPLNPKESSNMDDLPPQSPDSSLSSSQGSDTLSNISEAREIEQRVGSALKGSKENVSRLSHETLQRLELMSGSANKNKSVHSIGVVPVPASHRTDSQHSRPDSRASRPGSTRHPILPPIGASA